MLATRHVVALFLVVALCSAIIAAVVWKTQSKGLSQPTETRIGNAPDSDSINILEENSIGLKDESTTEPTKMLLEKQDDFISIDAVDRQIIQTKDENPTPETLKPADVDLNDELMKPPVKSFDPTIPSYAIDENGNVYEWVEKGPDMFDSLRLTDNASGNTATRRYMWFAHMNRLDETESLYDQLNITQNDIESNEPWVKVAVDVAKEIRRRIMQYFVCLSPEHAICDLNSWTTIQHEAPDAVQHRMRVFVAKLEFLKPFDHLRQVTQDDCKYPPMAGTVREYFLYLKFFDNWHQKYHDIAEEVERLSFRGCTRVFEVIGDHAAALEKIQKMLDLCIKILSTNPNLIKVVEGTDLLNRACGPGYEMFDRLPEPIKPRLSKFAELTREVVVKMTSL